MHLTSFRLDFDASFKVQLGVDEKCREAVAYMPSRAHKLEPKSNQQGAHTVTGRTCLNQSPTQQNIEICRGESGSRLLAVLELEHHPELACSGRTLIQIQRLGRVETKLIAKQWRLRPAERTNQPASKIAEVVDWACPQQHSQWLQGQQSMWVDLECNHRLWRVRA